MKCSLHHLLYFYLLVLCVTFPAKGQIARDANGAVYDTSRLSAGSHHGHGRTNHSATAVGSDHPTPCNLKVSPETRDSLIKNIRLVFKRINSQSGYHVETLSPDEFEEAVGGYPDNGGDATGYFKNDTLCKLVLSIGPSYGLKDYEYYYDRGQIIFIYEKDQHYPGGKDGGLNRDSIVTGLEARFYFDKGRLIAKKIDRKDDFMAEDINDAYVQYLLDSIVSFSEPLRKHAHRRIR